MRNFLQKYECQSFIQTQVLKITQNSTLYYILLYRDFGAIPFFSRLDSTESINILRIPSKSSFSQHDLHGIQQQFKRLKGFVRKYRYRCQRKGAITRHFSGSSFTGHSDVNILFSFLFLRINWVSEYFTYQNGFQETNAKEGYQKCYFCLVLICDCSLIWS